MQWFRAGKYSLLLLSLNCFKIDQRMIYSFWIVQFKAVEYRISNMSELNTGANPALSVVVHNLLLCGWISIIILSYIYIYIYIYKTRIYFLYYTRLMLHKMLIQLLTCNIFYIRTELNWFTLPWYRLFSSRSRKISLWE